MQWPQKLNVCYACEAKKVKGTKDMAITLGAYITAYIYFSCGYYDLGMTYLRIS